MSADDPKAIDRFLVRRRLGAGPFGTTFLCRDPQLEMDVVIKVFAADCAVAGYAPEIWRLRFLYEARTMAAIDHPNVLRVLSFGRLADSTPYMVMPRLACSLKDVLGSDAADSDATTKSRGKKAHRLPWQRALAILRQTLDGAAALHAAGLVHRDIKPGNILLTELTGGDARLSDFGLIKIPGLGLTRTRGWIGSARYMSPEQRRSSKHVDGRADVYSLGLVGYRMLVGALPAGVTVPPSARVERLPAALDEVLLRAIEADPADRYADAAEMRGALDPIALR